MPTSVLRARITEFDQIDVKLFGGLSRTRSSPGPIPERHVYGDAQFALLDREEDEENSEGVQQRKLTGCEEQVTVKVTDVSVAAYTVRLRTPQREGKQKQDRQGGRKGERVNEMLPSGYAGVAQLYADFCSLAYPNGILTSVRSFLARVF